MEHSINSYQFFFFLLSSPSWPISNGEPPQKRSLREDLGQDAITTWTYIDVQMRQVVDSVESIKHRLTKRDYLQPNESCPTWKQGLSHYQFVGPDDEFSTCYYTASRY